MIPHLIGQGVLYGSLIAAFGCIPVYLGWLIVQIWNNT